MGWVGGWEGYWGINSWLIWPWLPAKVRHENRHWNVKMARQSGRRTTLSVRRSKFYSKLSWNGTTCGIPEQLVSLVLTRTRDGMILTTEYLVLFLDEQWTGCLGGTDGFPLINVSSLGKATFQLTFVAETSHTMWTKNTFIFSRNSVGQSQYIYMYMYIYIYTYTYIYVCVCVCVCVCIWCWGWNPESYVC
jgi:hypothetical protein